MQYIYFFMATLSSNLLLFCLHRHRRCFVLGFEVVTGRHVHLRRVLLDGHASGQDEPRHAKDCRKDIGQIQKDTELSVESLLFDYPTVVFNGTLQRTQIQHGNKGKVGQHQKRHRQTHHVPIFLDCLVGIEKNKKQHQDCPNVNDNQRRIRLVFRIASTLVFAPHPPPRKSIFFFVTIAVLIVIIVIVGATPLPPFASLLIVVIIIIIVVIVLVLLVVIFFLVATAGETSPRKDNQRQKEHYHGRSIEDL
mmetsp:Transcript_19451/g.36779  ORF Transcript_19451/g.36779 Transcript_19451/m.36779 type:complete len:250 (-) Transcript_19451:144-893(-)